MQTKTHWEIKCISIDRAQNSLLFSAVLSVPTHRQCTNEQHVIKDWAPGTKNIVIGLWRFLRHCKFEVKNLQSQHDILAHQTKQHKETCNQILQSLTPSDFTESINWGCLSCTNVRQWFDDDGESGLIFSIEEVDPDSVVFIEAVETRIWESLKVKTQVKVICEW